MRQRRLDLHEELCTVLGSRNVYFQPPPNIYMKYPAIVYSQSGVDNWQANNDVYKQSIQYTVTAITLNPDSEIVTKLTLIGMCRFDRSYVKDNLYHNVFTLYR